MLLQSSSRPQFALSILSCLFDAPVPLRKFEMRSACLRREQMWKLPGPQPRFVHTRAIEAGSFVQFDHVRFSTAPWQALANSPDRSATTDRLGHSPARASEHAVG